MIRLVKMLKRRSLRISISFPFSYSEKIADDLEFYKIPFESAPASKTDSMFLQKSV